MNQMCTSKEYFTLLVYLLLMPQFARFVLKEVAIMFKKFYFLFFFILIIPFPLFAGELVLEYNFTSDIGNQVLDTSGNELNGTVQGSGKTHVGAGFSGKGLRLNGIDNFVLVPDHPLFDFSHYTLMAWAKFKLNEWDREEIMEKAGSFWMNIRQDTRKVRVGGYFGGCGNQQYYFKLDSDGAVPIDTWTHLAVTYDGIILRIYINGILSGKSAVPVPGPVCVNIEPLAVGSKHRIIPPPQSAAYFWGNMDSIRIFNVAFPAWRIKQQMNK